MKYLKTYKIFESNSYDKQMIEDFLIGFRDDEFLVDVNFSQGMPNLNGGKEDRILITIGDEGSLEDPDHDVPLENRVGKPDSLNLHDNIDSFNLLNDYLVDEGYDFSVAEIWIKDETWSQSSLFPKAESTTVKGFDNFIKTIEDSTGEFALVTITYKKSL